MPSDEPHGGTLLLAVCGGLWGSSLLFISEALDAFGPVAISLLRNVIAAVALGLWLWFAAPRPSASVVHDLVRRPGLAVLCGTAGLAAPQLLVAIAAGLLPTGLVAVVLATSPLLVALAAVWLMPGDGVGVRGTFGLLAGLAGVVVAVGGESLAAPGRVGPILLLLGAASMTAAYPMVMRRGYGSAPPTLIVLLSSIGACLPLLVLLPFDKTAPEPVSLDAIAALLALGLACTALPFALHAALVGRLGSVRAGAANYFIPVTGVLIGVLVLGEHLRETALLGLVLILGGVWVATRGRVVPVKATA